LKRFGEPKLGVRLLAHLFEVVYFASLKTEEGKPLQLRVAFVDPDNPDPHRPPHPRPDRWKITRLTSPLPLTVPNLTKLAKAADPWNSSLAVYYRPHEGFLLWGLVDQTVHFSTMLVRESGFGYAPPGVFQVLATGTADLTVYREHAFVARLAQDVLLTRQSNVFYSGPISDRLEEGIQRCLKAVRMRLSSPLLEDPREAEPELAEGWVSTLCRILISIQRYRHGGAMLITRSRSDLDIKYKIKYGRLPRALVDLGVATINTNQARDLISQEYLDQLSDNVPADLYLDEAVARADAEDYQREITGCVRFISSLSCVDGLILATPDLAIRGFGVEILTKKDARAVYLSSGPGVREKGLRSIDPNHYGMRHRSMMRYCYAHPRAVGFVISQDGEMRAMTRVNRRLIMWENLRVLSFLDLDFSRVSPRQRQAGG
jgi:hypothetical protein